MARCTYLEKPTPNTWIKPGPMKAKRHKYLKGEVGRAYDLAHAAWRAGIVQDFYYGRRDEKDSTIVWRLNGHEYDRSMSDHVFELVTRALADAGIVAAVQGPAWCGFPSLVLTLADGRQLVQRWNGTEIVAEIAA